MRRLYDHPVAVTVVAFAACAGVVLLIAFAYGFQTFLDAWKDPEFAWLLLVAGAVPLAIAAYVVAYRTVAGVHGGTRLSLSVAFHVVTAGFGLFAVGGGFAIDKQALCTINSDHRGSTVRVLGLGALEWAVLAPAAWVSAVVLLAQGDPRPMRSVLWPWAIAVPVGFAVGLWLTAPHQRERFFRGGGRVRRAVRLTLEGVGVLHTLAADLHEYWSAWAGIAAYWAFDIASFYGAVRFVGLQISVGETVLAFATGYALTRRSMPLGGAGATEALLTFSLHWLGQPVSASLAAVVVYRLFTFVLLAIPALRAHSRVEPLIDPATAASRPEGSLVSSPG